MKRNNLLIFLFVIIVLSIITIALAGCAGSTSGGANRTQGNQSMESVPKNTIIMKDNEFDPFTLGMKVGDTITWINEDPYDHEVKASNSEFDSGIIAKGAKFSFTFTKEGKYEYFCAIHTFMTGTINVFK